MEKKEFDLQVHHRDPKSQRIIKENHYVYHKHQEHGEVFERDGKFYDYQGEIITAPAWIKKAEQPVKVENRK